MNNNKTIVDLKKVSYANFFWTNGKGNTSLSRPPFLTVNGCILEEGDMAMWHSDYPNETMLSRAKRLNILDVWTPELRLQMTNSHSLVYTGQKAIDLWEAYRGLIFNKNVKKRKD